MRRLLVTILVLLVFLILLSQLQGLLLRSLGAVDGTFGVRPISQGCVGFIANHADAARVPLGNVEFHFGLFHFRYAVTEKDQLGERPICLGQDLWLGE